MKVPPGPLQAQEEQYGSNTPARGSPAISRGNRRPLRGSYAASRLRAPRRSRALEIIGGGVISADESRRGGLSSTIVEVDQQQQRITDIEHAVVIGVLGVLARRGSATEDRLETEHDIQSNGASTSCKPSGDSGRARRATSPPRARLHAPHWRRTDAARSSRPSPPLQTRSRRAGAAAAGRLPWGPGRCGPAAFGW